ncbi:MAG: Glutamate-semialdehyde aminotransferase [Myxococcales bacterium]|nr:Glutamate-semialdehyde aminotransferase [Myxococcales bacterium]
MVQDLEAKARELDAQTARAKDLPTTKRVLAKQQKTVAENLRRQAAGSIMFFDKPAVAAPLVPMIADRASGCNLYDLDGNEFIDLHMGYWTQIIGHAPSVVVEAVKREIERGTTIGVGNTLEIELAEFLIEHIECAEMCCLAISGTSALMHALKLARASRGRPKIAKFANAFHGHDADLVVDLPEFRHGLAATDDTLVLPGTPEAFDLIRKHADELAGVVIEPAPPVRDPRPSYDLAFYKELRRVTADLGIVLIFDEVLRGFRCRFGATLGDQVVPDLACFGKIIGGGLPVAAVVGRRSVMSAGATSGNALRDLSGGKVALVGTYNGNRIACAAGLAHLKYIKDHQDEIYPYLREKAHWLGKEINAHASEHKLPIESLVLEGGMVMVKGRPPTSPMHPAVLLQTYLRDQGCFFSGAPIQISTAHRPSDLERISAAFKAAMANLVADGAAPTAA